MVNILLLLLFFFKFHTPETNRIICRRDCFHKENNKTQLIKVKYKNRTIIRAGKRKKNKKSSDKEDSQINQSRNKKSLTVEEISTRKPQIFLPLSYCLQKPKVINTLSKKNFLRLPNFNQKKKKRKERERSASKGNK